METIAKQIRETVKIKTPYQLVAEKCNTTTLYVGQIARGERKPIRGKGLRILNELKELTKQE